MPRGFFEQPIFGSSARRPYDRRAAFFWLLEHAAIVPIPIRLGSHEVTLEPGQLAVPIRDIASVWGWPTMNVADFVRELYENRFIRTIKIGKYQIISICNFGDFSGISHPENSTARTTFVQSSYNYGVDARASPFSEESKNPTSDSPNGESSVAPPTGGADPVKLLWDRALAIVGASHRSLIGKLRRKYGDVAVAEAILACEDESPSEPVGFFIKCCERKAANGTDRKSTAGEERVRAGDDAVRRAVAAAQSRSRH